MSSSSGDSIEEARRLIGTERRSHTNMLRRFSLSITSDALWQLIGMLQLDSRTVETREAEPFLNAGFYSRPPVGVNAEAIVAFLGGDAENPVIIATRDEDTRRKAAADLAQGDTAIYGEASRAACRSSGLIELSSIPVGPLEFALRAQTYRSAEDSVFAAIGAFATAVGGSVPALAGAAATLNAALTAFSAAAATYLSQVVKLQ